MKLSERGIAGPAGLVIDDVDEAAVHMTLQRRVAMWAWSSRTRAVVKVRRPGPFTLAPHPALSSGGDGFGGLAE